VAEYLSPGVYVEEAEPGLRPIEGVSTSTAGVVGVTERGPENVPILLTSFADYRRTFGGYLDPAEFADTWYLPLSAEGFFQNGGQRLYVVRVASDGATTASVELMDRGAPTAFATTLLGHVQAGDRYLLVDGTAGPAGGATLRIDDGAASEYVVVGATPFPATADRVLALLPPTFAAYAGADLPAVGTPVSEFAMAATGSAFNEALVTEATAGSSRLSFADRKNLKENEVLRISDPADPSSTEYAIVAMVPALASDNSVTLRHPLAFDHATTAKAERLKEDTAGPVTALSQAVAPGSALLVVNNATGIGSGDTVRIGGPPATDPQAAYHLVGDVRVIDIEAPATGEHPVAELVATIDLSADAGSNGNLTADVQAGDDELRLAPGAPPNDLKAGDWIELGGGTAEFAQIAEIPATPSNTVRLRQPARGAHPSGSGVIRQKRAAGKLTRLVEHLHAGARTVLLAHGGTDFDAGKFVEIGEPGAPGREYRVLGPQGDLGVLPLTGATTAAENHRSGQLVELRAPLFEVIALDRGAWGNGLRVAVEDEDPPLVQTTSPGAGPMSNVPLASMSGVERGTLLEFLAFTTELAADAAAGATQIEVEDATAIGAGGRLRIGRAWPEYVAVAGAPAGGVVTLAEPLRRAHGRREPVDPMDSASGLPVTAKVAQRAGANAVTLEGGGLPAAVAPDTIVRSREFKLTVSWVKPNPRRPAEEIVVEAETHRHLTLDDRHSRYAARVVGNADGPVRLWDRRPEGGSDLVRVRDPLAPLDTETTTRVGPDLLFEVLPSGRRRPVARSLAGGDDDNGGVIDDTYRGQDDVDPLLRTGLQCLKNVEDISLVAIPGRTSDTLQGEQITHCETMRYRFALLDSVPGTDPTGAQLADVQQQRQRYDSKYAALYYPWLLRENPFPQGADAAVDVAIPPSGHMLGIFARTDVTRGVHKAPANEVIGGIRGLQRSLTKGEQDVLNPSPVNINVLRDFRDHNRGLRVWGARVITSDPAWRYVNVRRLFNYVERSLELGTQWVVFEPNDQNLWAQVRRSISAFLLLVYRSGGLMGRTSEQAFYVKCDESTMSQADIDAGRLIVEIGIAPTKPAEFVVVRISQWAGGSLTEEG
jgi:uncharacterized protein